MKIVFRRLADPPYVEIDGYRIPLDEYDADPEKFTVADIQVDAPRAAPQVIEPVKQEPPPVVRKPFWKYIIEKIILMLSRLIA